jgi:hypothetical protein
MASVVGMTDPVISEAWTLALTAIADELCPLIDGDPLPLGIVTAKLADWHFTLNNSLEPNGGLAPYAIKGRNDAEGAFCMLTLAGGMLVNYSEDRFICDLRVAMIVRAFGALQPLEPDR